MAHVFERKARVYEKIVNVSRGFYGDMGAQKKLQPSGFILNYSNKCNFTCEHCFTQSGSGDISDTKLTLEDIRLLADQADELGVYEIDIQGGEPLMYPNLFEIIEALGPERFYIYITTNGWLLTQELAEKLALAGVDRISVSIDSPDPAVHDKIRNKKGAFERAFQALEHTKNAGMRPYVNIVAGSFNVRDENFVKFCEQLISEKYVVVTNCATPTGNWRGNYDVMLSPEDTKTVEDIRHKYKNVVRDIWNLFDSKAPLIRGCPSVNLFYINPLGDVLPCPYIQTKLGNILEQPLKDILEYGYSFKYFNTFSSKCLAGEDFEFARNFLDQETSVLKPMDVKEFFNHTIKH